MDDDVQNLTLFLCEVSVHPQLPPVIGYQKWENMKIERLFILNDTRKQVLDMDSKQSNAFFFLLILAKCDTCIFTIDKKRLWSTHEEKKIDWK